MKGNNYHHKVITGAAIVPQSIANQAATAVAIPDSTLRKGRQLAFRLLAGAFATSATATCSVQGQKRADDAWENLKNGAGTDIAFTASELADGGALEVAGQFLGTVPVSEIDLAKYKAVRLLFTATHATATMVVAASFTLFDLYDVSGGQVDKLFALATVPVP